MTISTSRRGFLQGAAATGAALIIGISPKALWLLAKQPNSTLLSKLEPMARSRPL